MGGETERLRSREREKHKVRRGPICPLKVPIFNIKSPGIQRAGGQVSRMNMHSSAERSWPPAERESRVNIWEGKIKTERHFLQSTGKLPAVSCHGILLTNPAFYRWHIAFAVLLNICLGPPKTGFTILCFVYTLQQSGINDLVYFIFFLICLFLNLDSL